MPTVLVIVPSTESRGDTYVPMFQSAAARTTAVEYVTSPNDCYGDPTVTTIDLWLDDVITAYNSVCRDPKYKDFEIVLAGHAIGGLLVARMLSIHVVDRLIRRPAHVRIVSPLLSPRPTLLAKLYVHLPSAIQCLVPYIHMRPPDTLYPGSPRICALVKPCLLVSTLCRTGAIRMGNAPWDLTICPALAPCTRVIHRVEDTFASYAFSVEYTKKHQVQLVSLQGKYHEYFDLVLLTAFWEGISSV